MEPLKIPPPTNKDTQAYRIASTLMKLLNDGSVPKALWWLDDQTFAADPKYFQSQVLDPYFRGTKYASFLRTMHKMGFARLSRRFDLPKGVVAYACELFRKEKPDLMHKIRMCNSGKQAQALKEAMAKTKHQKSKTPTEVKSVETTTGTKKASPPASPLSVKKTKKPDPPSKDDDEKATAAEAAGEPNTSTVKRYFEVAAESNARIAMLRDRTAIELDAQRMFLQQQQHLQHQERLRRASLLQRTAMPANLLELALIQEALANRLTGPR